MSYTENNNPRLRGECEWIIKSIIDKMSPESLPALLRIKDKSGYTLFNLLMNQMKWEFIESIINKAPAGLLPELLQMPDADGDTVLHSAISTASDIITKLILDKVPIVA